MTSILGNGVAANCCAHLLGAAGLPVTIDRTDRPKVPALLISAATQVLIEDVFGRRDVFRAGRPVSKRVVAWGDGAEVVEMPHSGVVISEAELNERLQISPIEPETGAEIYPAADVHDWTICTVTLPEQRSEAQCFGTRVATASRVRLREGNIENAVSNGAGNEACWIESLENGWLFLLPAGSTSWLLAVGAPADDLLARSRMVAAQIDSHDAPTARFPAYPRITDPICGTTHAACSTSWLACGSAAMTFDPICGDGAGNAVREAILASAVIRTAHRGDNVEALLAHYRARLMAGFLKHLELCRQFYAACTGEWWREELALIDHGIEWCRARLRTEPAFRYQLRGFELEPAATPF